MNTINTTTQAPLEDLPYIDGTDGQLAAWFADARFSAEEAERSRVQALFDQLFAEAGASIDSGTMPGRAGPAVAAQPSLAGYAPTDGTSFAPHASFELGPDEEYGDGTPRIEWAAFGGWAATRAIGLILAAALILVVSDVATHGQVLGSFVAAAPSQLR